MNEIERELLEEYKRLDLLLKDMFGTETGVSEYISRMEAKKDAFRKVASLNNDLRQLKHVRHIRNKIMHDQDDSLCTEEDVDFACDFYDRLLDRRDPLAEFKEKKNDRGKHENRYDTDEWGGSYKDNSSSKITIILLVLLMILLIILAIELFLIL